MKHDAFRYDFTFREMFYFLFGRKVCPKCKGQMTRHKEFESVLGQEFNSRSVAPFHQKVNVKYYRYTYRCKGCGASYRLGELV